MDNFKIDGLTIKEHLQKLSESGNKIFTESLNPGVENVLGIRIGDLRKLASRIAKADWKQYLAEADTYYMEERMLQGLVLGSIKPDEDVEVYLERVSRFVRIINSWSVCDVFEFAGGKRFVAKYSERLWQYVCYWMQSDREYELRFGVVMSMIYFVDEAHIAALLSRYSEICSEDYYARMAVAWALSVCFVKFPEETMACLKTKISDDFIYRKALQKIVESRRVDEQTKAIVRSMRHSR